MTPAMITSVRSLHELLSTASNCSEASTTFLVEVLRCNLGYDYGEEAEVYKFLKDLILRVEEDLILALSGYQLNDALMYFNKFKKLIFWPIYTKTISELRIENNVLSSCSLNGLVTLNLILSNGIKPLPLDEKSSNVIKLDSWRHPDIGS